MPHIHTCIHTDTHVCTHTARLTTPSMPRAGVQTSSSWLSSIPHTPSCSVMSEKGHWILSWESDAQEKQDGKAGSEPKEQEVPLLLSETRVAPGAPHRERATVIPSSTRALPRLEPNCGH